MFGAGCWVLGARCWVLGAGCWVLGAGSSVFGACLQAGSVFEKFDIVWYCSCHLSLVTCHLSLVTLFFISKMKPISHLSVLFIDSFIKFIQLCRFVTDFFLPF